MVSVRGLGRGTRATFYKMVILCVLVSRNLPNISSNLLYLNMKLSNTITFLGAGALAAPASRLVSASSLPVEAQAGIHVIYSWQGLTPPDHLFELTRAGKVGGIILFKANMGANTTDIIDMLQAAYLDSPHAIAGAPLLIMTDQEGGQVRRVAGGPELTARQIGDSADPVKGSIEAGQEVADAFASYHINANLAPVLDIYREEKNFIDEYGRSFGNTSEKVAECAVPFTKTSQDLGVLSTAKHFPGLGAAVAGDNTDLTPVTIDLEISTLREIDMAPYVDLIQAGVKMVMTSWAIYPTLDELPAGLSSKWVHGELRERLGYKVNSNHNHDILSFFAHCSQGVTITDAIEAGSLKPFGSDAEVALMAVNAGMDLLLASGQDATQGEALMDAVIEALTAGQVNATEFEAGTQRILTMRRGLKTED